MTPVRATYRLQFRQGMDFDRAARLAPYLARLGVSHLYASPLFQATPGSTHGYDVTDHGRFDASLGGMEGFLRLSAALKAEGLGLILDIVPNHMAASPHTPWWRDVLRHGRASVYAGHFDVDWSAPKLTLPILGQPYGAALDAGEFALGHDSEGLIWTYYDTALPLAPESWPLVLDPMATARPDAVSDTASFAEWVADDDNAERLAAHLDTLSRDTDLLDRIHGRQAWRLVYWRAARDMLSYRRFFEISDLVGVRVEDDRVFDDVHRLMFAMLDAGHIDGIRVDHVDGLADPAGYLRRLQERAPRRPPIWVEKILAPDEPLPDGWPVAGTTGYEATAALAGLMTDPEGARAMTGLYDGFTGTRADPEAMLAAAKREILTYNLAAELATLTAATARLAADDRSARDWGPDSLRRALIAIGVAMPVYRTYLADDDASPADAAVLEQVERDARAQVQHDDPAVVGDVLRLIRDSRGPDAHRLRTRFQQTTGALMAKAMEDTLFYRYACLLSTNEVGSEPGVAGLDPQAFDREIVARARRQPAGLIATATHDTKRGEDARMRIAAIADDPAAWAEAVHDWEAMLAGDDAPAPEPRMRWLFYQALLGAWESDDLPALAERMAAYLVKAAREAKRATSWTAPDETYEQGLTAFVHRALSERPAFPPAFAEAAAPFIAAGARKSLVQLAFKLTLPGVPDIYQGTETADLSLVDPDNRTPVDFAARIAALDGSAPFADPFARSKLALLHRLLAMRGAEPTLFARGTYRMLAPRPDTGGRYFGFGRAHRGTVLIVLGELSAPPRADARPEFALPRPWRALAIDGAGPGLDCADGILTPRDGFAELPVIVALGALPRRP